MPPLIAVQVGEAKSEPMAVEPLVAVAVITLPALVQYASAYPPAPEAFAVALHFADALAAAIASAPPLAVAFAVPPFCAPDSVMLPSPLEEAFAVPPPPSTKAPAAADASVALATASPPPASIISAIASAPPEAFDVALPPPLTTIEAVDSLPSPSAVALVVAPSCASDIALVLDPVALLVALPPFTAWDDDWESVPDASLLAVAPSSASDSAEPKSEAFAVALLGGPSSASQAASVPSLFIRVTFVLFAEHDSWSECASASPRATTSASMNAAVAIAV